MNKREGGYLTIGIILFLSLVMIVLLVMLRSSGFEYMEITKKYNDLSDNIWLDNKMTLLEELSLEDDVLLDELNSDEEIAEIFTKDDNNYEVKGIYSKKEIDRLVDGSCYGWPLYDCRYTITPTNTGILKIEGFDVDHSAYVESGFSGNISDLSNYNKINDEIVIILDRNVVGNNYRLRVTEVEKLSVEGSIKDLDNNEWLVRELWEYNN